jgi:hypothetical protein
MVVVCNGNEDTVSNKRVKTANIEDVECEIGTISTIFSHIRDYIKYFAFSSSE